VRGLGDVVVDLYAVDVRLVQTPLGPCLEVVAEAFTPGRRYVVHVSSTAVLEKLASIVRELAGSRG